MNIFRIFFMFKYILGVEVMSDKEIVRLRFLLWFIYGEGNLFNVKVGKEMLFWEFLCLVFFVFF